MPSTGSSSMLTTVTATAWPAKGWPSGSWNGVGTCPSRMAAGSSVVGSSGSMAFGTNSTSKVGSGADTEVPLQCTDEPEQLVAQHDRCAGDRVLDGLRGPPGSQPVGVLLADLRQSRREPRRAAP